MMHNTVPKQAKKKKRKKMTKDKYYSKRKIHVGGNTACRRCT